MGRNRSFELGLDSYKADARFRDILFRGYKPPEDRSDGLHREGHQREEQGRPAEVTN